MKFKKIFSTVISIAMSFSLLANNVTANNDLPTNNSIEIVCENSNGSQSILNQFENEYRYEDIADISSLNYIPVDTLNYGIMTCSDNSAPIAGLTYVVANPESIVNGSFTTDTIIYWLWNDGTTAYTYDPDGDDITNILIDGVYDYILGNVTIGDEVVGFATQITEAAEHELFYQVVDSNGNYSNVVYYTFEIEPADGNTRPICIASPSNSDFFINTPVTINWGSSYDSDEGDTIASVRVRVYHNGYYELITTSSDYYVSMTNTSMNLVFDEIGTYEIWVSLSDNHNAWSNWNISEITVQAQPAYVFENVTLTSDDPNNTNSTAFVWADYATSVEYATETDNAEALYDLVKVNSIPSQFANRTIISMNWTISGYVKTSSGSPVANQTVSIIIPMPGQNYQKDITTNAQGFFTYTSTNAEWYAGWGQEYDSSGGLSGVITEWCRYGNYDTTSWMVATNLYVACSSVSDYESFPVTATAGSIHLKILGNRWYYGSVEGSIYKQWIDMG